jgi:hypothetical protein
MASIRGNEKYIYHFGDQPEELFAWMTRGNAQYGRILVNGNPLLGEE